MSVSSPNDLKAHAERLPQRPGVYLMRNADEEVIYIGKARDIRSRVKSYFSGTDGRISLPFLMNAVTAIESIVTEGERQALLLESDLIKKYRPRYNVRLKDDKSYLLVRVDTANEWPRLELVRRVGDDGARYIGPFAFSHELYALLEVVQRTFPLRTCSDRVMHNRVRPCLEYQMKRCAAPCCLLVDHEHYLEWIEGALRVLEGRNLDVLKDLTYQMEVASKELRYEDAAQLRDRIEVLKKITTEKPKPSFGDGSQDAFGVYREGSEAELSVLVVREGRLCESKTFGFSGVELPDEEFLASVVSQYYLGGAGYPELILLPETLEDLAAREDLYTERAGREVSIVVPERGAKARLLKLAGENAEENYRTRFVDRSRGDSAVSALKDALGLEEMPRTIECVDISHFQGGETVGSLVVFQDGVKDKDRYRRFHLSQEAPDDFASMREVVARHLTRASEEGMASDLMVVDGGPAQLSQAISVRDSLGLHRPAMIGLAKKRRVRRSYLAFEGSDRSGGEYKPERVYLEGAARPVVLDPSSEALYLLEQLRNEAHRFAISFHRSQRAKRTFRSELENIPGIGPKRRRDLLKEFRSVEAIRSAEPEDLHQRCGIPLTLAEKVVGILRARRGAVD